MLPDTLLALLLILGDLLLEHAVLQAELLELLQFIVGQLGQLHGPGLVTALSGLLVTSAPSPPLLLQLHLPLDVILAPQPSCGC